MRGVLGKLPDLVCSVYLVNRLQVCHPSKYCLEEALITDEA